MSEIKRVLNAFRHHRGGHDLVSILCRQAEHWCSTPFGITEVGMRMPPSRFRPIWRAQRLSASQRWAFKQKDGKERRYAKCSTPFGITEVGMNWFGVDQEGRDLCSTPFGITEVGMG